MAEENKLNAKIQLRNDSLENWNKNPTVILQQGEVGFVKIPGNNASTPTILFKVGDGKTQFAKLPWVTALAADVYAWAKAENKPTYTASEVGVTESNFPGLNKTGTVTSVKLNDTEKTPINGVVDLGTINTPTDLKINNDGYLVLMNGSTEIAGQTKTVYAKILDYIESPIEDGWVTLSKALQAINQVPSLSLADGKAIGGADYVEANKFRINENGLQIQYENNIVSLSEYSEESGEYWTKLTLNTNYDENAIINFKTQGIEWTLVPNQGIYIKDTFNNSSVGIAFPGENKSEQVLTVDSLALTKDHLINWGTGGIEDSGIDKTSAKNLIEHVKYVPAKAAEPGSQYVDFTTTDIKNIKNLNAISAYLTGELSLSKTTSSKQQRITIAPHVWSGKSDTSEVLTFTGNTARSNINLTFDPNTESNILTDNNINNLYAEASDINALFGITSTTVSENTTASENTVVRE